MTLGPYELNTIYTGDARELVKAIPDESIDLIFTDPPYTKEFIPLYGWLAEFGARALKRDGFLLTYVGHYWLDDCMTLIRPYLSYFFMLTSWNRQVSPVMHNRHIVSKGKAIIAYRRHDGTGVPSGNTVSIWVGSGNDKAWHRWGQDEDTVRYYAWCFNSSGGLVLDPFAGGGTVPWVCQKMGWPWLAFEVDPDAANIARQRIAGLPPPNMNWQLPLFDEAAR